MQIWPASDNVGGALITGLQAYDFDVINFLPKTKGKSNKEKKYRCVGWYPEFRKGLWEVQLHETLNIFIVKKIFISYFLDRSVLFSS